MNKNTMYILGALGLGVAAYLYFKKSKTTTAPTASEEKPTGEKKMADEKTESQQQGGLKNLQQKASELFPVPASGSTQEKKEAADKQRKWINNEVKKIIKGGKSKRIIASKAMGSKDTTPAQEDSSFAFNGIVF